MHQEDFVYQSTHSRCCGSLEKSKKNYLDSPNRVETLKNGPVNKLGEATKSLFELLTFLTPQPHATKKKSRAHGTLLLKTTP